jgi:hypothetical protein
VQELATAFIEKLNIKVLLLNNQHLGMVVQWEDRFYKVRCISALIGLGLQHGLGYTLWIRNWAVKSNLGSETGRLVGLWQELCCAFGIMTSMRVPGLFRL